MDIVILSLSRWDGKYSSTILSMAKVLARNHRVFYVDNPFTIKESLVRLFSRQVMRRWVALFFGMRMFSRPLMDLPAFVAVTPSITLSINWLPKGRVFNFLSDINDRIVFRAIRKTIEHFGIREYVYINSFNPLYGNHFPVKFKPHIAIYHCVDDISRSPWVSRHGTRLENAAIRKADMVITTSGELARAKSSYSKNVNVISNAANVSLFQRAVYQRLPRPVDLQNLSWDTKVITYMGNICHRIDYDLLNAIADRLYNYLLLMVGPFANNLYKVSGLNKRQNVLFTGQKSLEELPAYLQHSHCCIIPFLCNNLSKSIYPLKINEYLSAGKPVVTTPFSEDIRSFKDIALVAENHDDFIRKIQEAIATDNVFLQKRRVAFAAPNNWEDRADKLLKLVEGFGHGR